MATRIIPIEEHIRKNKRDTFFICSVMLIFLFGIIFAGGYLLGLPPFLSAIIGIFFALIYIFLTYSFSVQSVLAAAKARPDREAGQIS